MGLLKSQVIYFLLTICLPLISRGEELATPESIDLLPSMQSTCATPTPWSDSNYEELRAKLETILKEKNKSLISLDFKGLQAQVDVAVNHLISQDNLSDEEFKSILKKNISYLEELEGLMNKAKETARMIKEGHVVPLAAITSLKAESDKCAGSESQYSHIFQTLSQLNKDFNEILMMSPQKVTAQKSRVVKMLDQLEDGKIKLSGKIAAEHFNFIQNQINSVTAAFEFDLRLLQIASH